MSGVRRGTRGERGSVLMLFPAAVFAVLVLAAITLDFGLAHVRAQQLRSVAASAANDSAGAVDLDGLRDTGRITLDQASAERLVRQAVAAGPLPDARVDSVVLARRSADRWEVTVTLSYDVRFVIAPALPGARRSLTVTSTARALAVVH